MDAPRWRFRKTRQATASELEIWPRICAACPAAIIHSISPPQIPLLAASCLVNVIGGVRQAMRVRRARRAAGEDDESHVLDAPVHPIDIEWRELRCELRTKKGVKKILR